MAVIISWVDLEEVWPNALEKMRPIVYGHIAKQSKQKRKMRPHPIWPEQKAAEIVRRRHPERRRELPLRHREQTDLPSPGN